MCLEKCFHWHSTSSRCINKTWNAVNQRTNLFSDGWLSLEVFPWFWKFARVFRFHFVTIIQLIYGSISMAKCKFVTKTDICLPTPKFVVKTEFSKKKVELTGFYLKMTRTKAKNVNSQDRERMWSGSFLPSLFMCLFAEYILSYSTS